MKKYTVTVRVALLVSFCGVALILSRRASAEWFWPPFPEQASATTVNYPDNWSVVSVQAQGTCNDTCSFNQIITGAQIGLYCTNGDPVYNDAHYTTYSDQRDGYCDGDEVDAGWSAYDDRTGKYLETGYDYEGCDYYSQHYDSGVVNGCQ